MRLVVSFDQMIDFEEALAYMDDEIVGELNKMYEQYSHEMAPSDQVYFDEYCDMHANKFKKSFDPPIVSNPV